MSPVTKTDAGRALTGLDHAFVNTTLPAPKNVVQVYTGQPLPADLADGELERLEQLGAFGEHPRDRRARVVETVTVRSEDTVLHQEDIDAMLATLDRVGNEPVE